MRRGCWLTRERLRNVSQKLFWDILVLDTGVGGGGGGDWRMEKWQGTRDDIRKQGREFERDNPGTSIHATERNKVR